MDDMGPSSTMMLLRMLPAATAVLSIVVTLSLFGPLVLYAIARWRANRSGVADPHLGLKFALHWFATSAFHLGLAGAAGLVFAMISPGSGKGDLYRFVFALLVPAGMILGLHIVLLKRTNDDEVPGVRRLFLGYNLFVTGLIGFIALVMGFQILFAKGSAAPVSHMVGSMVVVYCSAWAVLGHRFGQLVLGGPGSGELPEVVMPPGPPPAAPPPAAAGGGGLPALGGGSYPPIDR
jgi:hypothetical protein